MYAEAQWVMQSDNDIAKKMTDAWGAVPFPGPAGSPYVVPTQVKGWALANGGKNPKAASYFLRYFLDPNNLSTAIWGKGDNDINSMFSTMASYNKNADISQGTVGYNTFGSTTKNDYFDLQALLIGSAPDQLNTSIASFSTRLDGILGDLNK